MTTPEAYIQLTPGVITQDGQVTDASTARFLQRFITKFQEFIAYSLAPATSKA
jgi:chromate reductase